MAVRAKVCGITNLEDAKKAIEYGASYLGLIFVPSSPRNVSAETAKDFGRYQNDEELPLVGVFKDPSRDEVARAITDARIHMVQLHGQETVDFCRETELPVIKAIEIDPSEPSEPAAIAVARLKANIEKYSQVCPYLLFDRPKNAKAQSLADWLVEAISLLQQAGPVRVPFFFAGGLHAGNVATVIAALSPFAIDVASGVESEPGKKDHEKIAAFMRAVRNGTGQAGAET